MAAPKKKTILNVAKERITGNFKFATLSFLFIILYINIFQLIFGMENSIVGVIFVIMMASSMARDLTSAPLKHLLLQSAVLVLMAVAACLTAVLNPWLALPVNFFMIALILYSYTYEYSSHLYFPYILSYLFLVFIAPESISRLPVRIAAMVTGAVCIILYQLVMGRHRAADTVTDVLLTLIEEAKKSVSCLLKGAETPGCEVVQRNLRRLGRMVYERRKWELCISDAGFAVVDCGRGLEHLLFLLSELKNPSGQPELLKKIMAQLEHFRAYVEKKSPSPMLISRKEFLTGNSETEGEFYGLLEYICSHLVHMNDPEKKIRFRPALSSFSFRLQTALKVSRVRVVYALRVALLLSLGTLIVSLFHLSHGRWLLFTIASVSLPYADDVGQKAFKRLLATLLGGLFSVVLYTLIPSPTGRTVIMMLSGYLSFYFTDYAGNFTCSTVGALGGAVFMNAFGFAPVSQILLIRLAYICAGIVIAYAANCLLFPYRRSTAAETLLKKYEITTKLLGRLCRQEVIDVQFYYHLVIESQLIEDKLYQMAAKEELEKLQDKISHCRAIVREAHRTQPKTNRLNAHA